MYLHLAESKKTMHLYSLCDDDGPYDNFEDNDGRRWISDEHSNGGDDDKDTSLCHPLIWKTKDLKMRPDRFVWTAQSTGWQQMLPVLEQLEFYQILQKCIWWINSKNISIIQIWRELLQPDWGSWHRIFISKTHPGNVTKQIWQNVNIFWSANYQLHIIGRLEQIGEVWLSLSTWAKLST